MGPTPCCCRRRSCEWRRCCGCCCCGLLIVRRALLVLPPPRHTPAPVTAPHLGPRAEGDVVDRPVRDPHGDPQRLLRLSPQRPADRRGHCSQRRALPFTHPYFPFGTSNCNAATGCGKDDECRPSSLGHRRAAPPRGRLRHPHGRGAASPLCTCARRTSDLLGAVGQKWHLGFKTWKYTPTEGGFDSHLGYYAGSTDYYTQDSLCWPD